MKRRFILSILTVQVMLLSACGMNNNNDDSEFDQQQTINDTNYQESENGS